MQASYLVSVDFQGFPTLTVEIDCPGIASSSAFAFQAESDQKNVLRQKLRDNSETPGRSSINLDMVKSLPCRSI